MLYLQMRFIMVQMRSLKERVFQTLGYEITALLILVPIYQFVFSSSTQESWTLLVTLAIAVMIFSPLHNTIFDKIEASITNKNATQRTKKVRLLHACTHEATAITVTLPIIMYIAKMSFFEALLVDIGLTIAYAIHAYIYYWFFDVLFPLHDDFAETEFLDTVILDNS